MGQFPNLKGRPKGSFSPSTFVKKELFIPNKGRIKQIVLNTLDEAEHKGTQWAVKLIFEYFIGKQTDLDDDNVQALFEDKLKDLSKEHLEKIRREVYEAIKANQLTSLSEPGLDSNASKDTIQTEEGAEK